MNAVARRTIRLACILAACGTPLGALGAEAAGCAIASLTNPNATPAGAGGMGGTGNVADTQPVTPGTGGMGGTGAVAGAGGMGGTGTVADVVPGTGGMGGTGIVGVITGFASICVNNVEVHYDNNTPVAVNGRPAAARDLAVGQVVAVNARAVGNRLQAVGIGVIDAVSGPITRVNAAAREIQVMGQTVRTDASAGTDVSALRVGTIARVSGHRTQNGEVIATRIEVGTGADASVLGTVTRVEADAVIVQGTRVTMGRRGTQGITVGSEVFAAGEWSNGTLRAQRVDAQPVRNAIARNERAILEGYIRGKTTRTLNVGGVTVQTNDRVRYNGGNDRDADVGRKIQVEVRRSGNGWQAERVRLQRDDRPTRSRRDGQTQDAGTDDRSGSGNSGSGNSGSERSDSRDSSGSGSRDSSGSGRDSGSSGRDSGRSGRDSGSSGSGSGSSSGSGRGGSGRR